MSEILWGRIQQITTECGSPPATPRPSGIHILTLRTMNIGLYVQRTFMDVIKGLEIGDYPRLSGLSQNVFIRGRRGRAIRGRQRTHRGNTRHGCQRHRGRAASQGMQVTYRNKQARELEPHLETGLASSRDSSRDRTSSAGTLTLAHCSCF